ncbi:MAG: hypothetical protein A3F94_03355 [Candidatus Spechtbacteria bacterium RIFCSPLOWO2_12_FULL_38_22]|uniref:Baseplate protein J-like domain-containing protein n=1 Tax=Candidatus Spechtbacteria bacterium RIFCSPLOWO2_12_FULL_38_22 TaxID=1802165 RepID=A0A1G2HIN5_9BACT|nr:MAG: hypothetical protein A2728_03195 [Candidatus Spechtbacteria bacterium RIFCSPHIGHO2_01_FULL_38_11]OGZ59230.1 MAG: hypothetical protein A3E58_01365 [Candidatus Spechtbacteria bacterium RIFCSPHIGHO2_12_FULL_38_30]OGZ60832.1 MAG: hypothetical protein A3A00_02595 [Candidatus Spechtbacteria bacterium RIFCSPLOWO2_01_FULL_38_20]OGZ62364.1 MAG: hypothetical protein A3F94_03355 [Candidatus Spechtbacteria bacterium RIFCSPLOWO2_12_FULL_38_22]
MFKNSIKVEAFDELALVIDKILTNDADIVFLEIAEDAYIAQNVLNFRLLKREADVVGKSVVVVSNNPRIRSLASKASLRTRESLPPPKRDTATSTIKSISTRPQRMVTDIVAPSTDMKDMELEEKRMQDIKIMPAVNSTGVVSEKPAKNSSRDNFIRNLKQSVTSKVSTHAPTEEVFYKKKKRSFELVGKVNSVFSRLLKNPKRFLITALGSLVLGFLGYLLIFVLPSATITLYPKTIQDTIATQISLDSNVSSADLSKGIIPAQVLEERRENNFTFKATGEADLETRAEGQIRVFNEFSSVPQTLVANTRFLSSEGQLFRTVSTVVVPGASISGGKIVSSSMLVDVVADAPGKESNIGSTNFSIPGFKGTDKYLKFYGKSESSMEGGFKGKTTVVTQEDIDKAKEKVNEEFLNSVEQTLRDKVPDNLLVVAETFEVEFETVELNAEPQDPKEEFSMRVVAVARTFLVKESDVLDAIEHFFVNSTEYSKDYELSDKRRIVYNVKELDYSKGYSSVVLEVDSIFNRSFPTELLYEEIRGKNEVEVRRILSAKEELERAQVRLWPFWVRTIPQELNKIEINLQYNSELTNN